MMPRLVRAWEATKRTLTDDLPLVALCFGCFAVGFNLCNVLR